jgi:pimeloyl-ACP methyl ester carboxylesterase
MLNPGDNIRQTKTIEPLAGFPFGELKFGLRGDARSVRPAKALISYCRRNKITDMIFLAHGFRGNAASATSLYMRLLANLGANFTRPEFASRIGGRKFAAVGVYWNSEEYPESVGGTESARDALDLLRKHCATPYSAAHIGHARSLLRVVEIDHHAQDEFVASVLRAFGDGSDDPAEGLPLLRGMRGSELLAEFHDHATRRSGGIDNMPFVSPASGGVGAFLNFMTWSALKKMSGTVGTRGLADMLIAGRRKLGASVKFHLVGHSLGARLAAECCRELGQRGDVKVDSLTLLEGAFSQFGFSPDAGSGRPGFFRDVIEKKVVTGPMISTFSNADAVLKNAYSFASRLHRNRLQYAGDASSPYAAIGANGAQQTPESAAVKLQRAGNLYRNPFESGILTCLDGTPWQGERPHWRRRKGEISGHDDVTNANVTYAIASAVL